MPDDFSEVSRGVGLLRSVDAYGRPAAVLLIAANVRITRRDFILLVRLTLGVGLLLGIIAAGQLLELVDGPVNRFLFDYYDNNPGNHFWDLIIYGGRVAAFMPQLSTLGMYVVLGFGLLAAQLMGGRAVKSAVIFGLLAGGIFLAGILSGSKVFVGGTVMLLVGVIFLFRSVRRDSVLKIMAGVIAIPLVFFASSEMFPRQTEGFVGVAIPRPPQSDDSSGIYDEYVHRFYVVYLASRFDKTDGKVFRTGAMSIASRFPITGLGMNVVHRTTDSLALGIFIMGGAIGSGLYLGALAAMGFGLLRIAKNAVDPESAGMAKVLLLLTFIFLVMSIGFHTFIQDRAGDAYWLLAGLMVGPMNSIAPSQSMTRSVNS